MTGHRAILWVGLLLLGGDMASALPPGRTLTSTSRQFIVSSSIHRSLTPGITQGNSPTNIVQLTPGRLVLVADRVKTMFLRQLHAPDNWHGGIRLHLEPGNGRTSLKRTRYADGWQYYAILPENIRTIDLVRLLTDLLLAEMTERYSQREIEAPLWLRVGLAETIQRNAGPGLFAPLGARRLFEGELPDPYRGTRVVLLKKQPLAYTDLSLPTRAQLAGTNWDLYRASAHLFTQQLLSRRNGHTEMRAFIRQLQNFKNSQFAFLKSFQLTDLSTAKKTSLLDVEKWWTVASMQFRSRDRRNNWSPEQTLAHLEETLRLQPEPGQPMRLQQGLAKLDLARQQKHLADTMFRLKVLSANAPPGLQPLIRDYHNTLNDYYRKRRLGPGTNDAAAPKDALSKRIIQQLNQLDTIMADFQLQGPANTAFGKTLSPPRP
jgi:hypothetical protein